MAGGVLLRVRLGLGLALALGLGFGVGVGVGVGDVAGRGVLLWLAEAQRRQLGQRR